MRKATVWFSGECSLLQYFVYWIVLTIIASFAGPFGTYAQIDLSERFMLWSFVTSVALIEVWVSKRIVTFLFPKLSARLKVLCLCTVFSAMFAVVPLCCVYLFSQTVHIDMVEATFTAFIICAFSHFGTLLESDAVQEPAVIKLPRLIRRLPEEKQGTLLRMTACDHYVEVHTDKGMHKLLMRLRDATEETQADGVDGFFVHRSHWVMRGAIDRVEQSGARPTLCMKDGSIIPIGQKYRQNVVDAGYL